MLTRALWGTIDRVWVHHSRRYNLIEFVFPVQPWWRRPEEPVAISRSISRWVFAKDAKAASAAKRPKRNGRDEEYSLFTSDECEIRGTMRSKSRLFRADNWSAVASMEKTGKTVKGSRGGIFGCLQWETLETLLPWVSTRSSRKTVRCNRAREGTNCVKRSKVHSCTYIAQVNIECSAGSIAILFLFTEYSRSPSPSVEIFAERGNKEKN